MSIFKSFGFALNGLKTAVKEGRNLKIHFVAAITVIVSGFYFKVTNVEWTVLLLLIGLVIGFELLNSAIENLTDLVTKESHPLAGRVKDIAAAAVLFVVIISVITGIIIFAKYIV